MQKFLNLKKPNKNYNRKSVNFKTKFKYCKAIYKVKKKKLSSLKQLIKLKLIKKLKKFKNQKTIINKL